MIQENLTGYQQRGYETRSEYLSGIAAENGLDDGAVFAVADMLGPSEDFDGLLSAFNIWDTV